VPEKSDRACGGIAWQGHIGFVRLEKVERYS
jgi:hypothetical protein